MQINILALVFLACALQRLACASSAWTEVQGDDETAVLQVNIGAHSQVNEAEAEGLAFNTAGDVRDYVAVVLQHLDDLEWRKKAGDDIRNAFLNHRLRGRVIRVGDESMEITLGSDSPEYAANFIVPSESLRNHLRKLVKDGPKQAVLALGFSESFWNPSYSFRLLIWEDTDDNMDGEDDFIELASLKQMFEVVLPKLASRAKRDGTFQKTHWPAFANLWDACLILKERGLFPSEGTRIFKMIKERMVNADSSTHPEDKPEVRPSRILSDILNSTEHAGKYLYGPHNEGIEQFTHLLKQDNSCHQDCLMDRNEIFKRAKWWRQFLHHAFGCNEWWTSTGFWEGDEEYVTPNRKLDSTFQQVSYPQV